jgi:hypothetical protein
MNLIALETLNKLIKLEALALYRLVNFKKFVEGDNSYCDISTPLYHWVVTKFNNMRWIYPLSKALPALTEIAFDEVFTLSLPVISLIPNSVKTDLEYLFSNARFARSTWILHLVYCARLYTVITHKYYRTCSGWDQASCARAKCCHAIGAAFGKEGSIFRGNDFKNTRKWIYS